MSLNKLEERRKSMEDEEEEDNNPMTASYSEISFPARFSRAGAGTCATSNHHTVKDASLEEGEEAAEKMNLDEDTDDFRRGFTEGNILDETVLLGKTELSSCNASPSHIGSGKKMTHFVSSDMEYRLKMSNSFAKQQRNSIPFVVASGFIPKQFFPPNQIPQIDSNVLNDLELEAQYLAASLDNLTENLCNLLHSISAITADNVEIHKNAVNKLTDSMDANIKCMYTIMAKTEEISKSMKPTEQIAQRIREIKRLVDMLESNM